MTADTVGNIYDVAVIGAGTIGLSAAYHASARGLSTVLIDQYELGNDKNSSKGLERMFRILYSQESRVRLVETSYAMWHEMESQVGYPILAEKPMLFFGDPEKTTFEGNLGDIANSMHKLGIPFDYYESPAAIANAFPVFNAAAMPANYVGLRQNMGATILVDKSRQAFSDLCDRSGRVAKEMDQSVIKIKHDGTNYHVDTTDSKSKTRSYTAKHIIVAPGIWLKSVLTHFGLSTADGWKIWVMTLGYFNTHPALRDDIPIWYEFSDKEYYGFQPTGEVPVTGHPYAVKISADFPGFQTTDPKEAIRQGPSNEILNSIQNHIDRLFAPGVVNSRPIPNTVESCNYSMQPDGDMVLGKIPKAPETENYWPNASIFCMASGRGFKFTPLWGRILVDLAVEGKTAYAQDIAAFSTTRRNVFKNS